MAETVGKVGQLRKFLREVRAELRKVVWPNRKELTTYTGVVIVAVAALAVFFGISDLIIARILALLLRLRG
ncbi:MAG: preprotein translocase subunit SecE [Limnochordia bacterium]|jgi:preprotein translocase subunit SecE